MNTEPIGFNNDDISFIENALNFYWNNAHTNLLRKDLVDIEKRNYEYQLLTSKHLMQRIDQNSNQFTASNSMAIALQKINNTSEDSGKEGCTYGDTDYDSLSVVYGYNTAISQFKEIAKEALKEAGL